MTKFNFILLKIQIHDLKKERKKKKKKKKNDKMINTRVSQLKKKQDERIYCCANIFTNSILGRIRKKYIFGLVGLENFFVHALYLYVCKK
jgi:hypothetical protein